MILTKKEFKQLLKANDLEIRYINNYIQTRTEYVDNPEYDPNYVLGDGNWDFRKGRKYNEVKVPVTTNWRYSDWNVCVPIRYKGTELYMWFRAMFWENDTVVKFHLDHIWNGGTGKKIRRDARWNIERKLEQKVKEMSRTDRPVSISDTSEPKTNEAETWYQFCQWFPEVGQKLRSNFLLKSITIEAIDGTKFTFKND